MRFNVKLKTSILFLQQGITQTLIISIKPKKMTLSDFTILGKKILVGIVVTLVPFIIIFGGLYLTRHLLSDKKSTNIINTK